MTGHRIQEIIAYIQQHRHDMLSFLTALVETETPSRVPQSQDAAFAILSQKMESFGYRVLRFRGKETGGFLIGRPEDRERNKPIQLLIGHCDTVWPLGTLEDMKITHDQGQMHGPGIYDMKAGLTQIVYALQTCRDLKLKPPVTPVVFINSDEEIGSRESAYALKRLARIADRAYVLEPPLGLDGKLKTARKGIARFTITITGQPAHAGLDPRKGASAILELSHQIQKLFAMNDHERGVTVNVGMIEGGISANVVAPQSSAVIDVRTLTTNDAKLVTEKIQSLQPRNKNTTLVVEGGFGRPPMESTERNRKLWQAARNAGGDIGLDLREATAGGGSDGNITSQYCATLDGLGTTGDGAHARHEFIFTEQLLERTALLTLLVMMPPVDTLPQYKQS